MAPVRCPNCGEWLPPTKSDDLSVGYYCFRCLIAVKPKKKTKKPVPVPREPDPLVPYGNGVY